MFAEIDWLPGLSQPVVWLVDKLSLYRMPRRALGLARRYTRLRSRDPIGWLILEQLVRTLDGETEADDVLKEGLTFLPNDVVLSSRLASNFIDQDRLEEAEIILLPFLEELQESPLPFLELSRIRLLQKRDSEGQLLVQKALSRATISDNPEVGFQLSASLLMIPTERNRGEEMLRLALQHAPRHAWGNIVMGILVSETDPIQAERHFGVARSELRRRGQSFDVVLAEVRVALGVEQNTDERG